MVCGTASGDGSARAAGIIGSATTAGTAVTGAAITSVDADAVGAARDGVHALRPGITGWAQVNGRDELPIPDKVALDAAYLHQRSFSLDVRILWMTLWKVVRRDGVSH